MGSITNCITREPGPNDINLTNTEVTLIGELFNKDTRILMALLQMSGVDYDF